MLPYIFIILLAFIVYWNRNQNNKGLYYFFMICCILMVGSRDMIGGFDVYIYGEVFEYPLISMIYKYSSFEQGFNTYNVLIRQITDDRYFFFFITAAITYLLHFGIIKKLSPLLMFSIFLYFCKFFLMSFVYLRQFLAVSIVWWSLPFIFKGKKVVPLLMMLLAFYFHRSSVIFTPFIFISQMRLSRNQMLMIVFGFLVVFLSPVGNFVMESLASGTESDKLKHYSELSGGINFLYLGESLVYIYLASIYKNEFYKDKKTTAVFNGFLCFILVTLLSVTNATYVRFTWYFYIFVVLALPYMYLYMKNGQDRRNFRLVVFVYFSAMMIRLLFLWDGGDLMPYKAFYIDTERHGLFDYMEYRNSR